jgi:hypothetical protein
LGIAVGHPFNLQFEFFILQFAIDFGRPHTGSSGRSIWPAFMLLGS